MGRKVTVAEIEPGLAVVASQGFERVEALALEAPAVGLVDDAAQRIGDGIDIRRDVESKELLVVTGVHDYREAARIDPEDEAAQELSCTHSPRQRGDHGLQRGEGSAARHWEPFCRKACDTELNVPPECGQSRRISLQLNRRGGIHR